MSESIQLDREQIVRLAVVMESLATEVRHLTEKVEVLKDTRVVELEKVNALLEQHMVVLDGRISTIEDNNTWLVRLLFGEGVALLGGMALWLINFIF